MVGHIFISDTALVIRGDFWFGIHSAPTLYRYPYHDSLDSCIAPINSFYPSIFNDYILIFNYNNIFVNNGVRCDDM